MADPTPLVPSLVKRQIRARGPIEATVLNDTLDEVHADVIKLTDFVTRLDSERVRQQQVLTEEVITLRERLAELENRKSILDTFTAEDNGTLYYTSDFADLSAFDSSAFQTNRRVRVDSVYGIATVPYNAYRSRFHIIDPRTNRIFVPGDLDASTTVLDEGSGEVTEGTPANAFNGQNESFFVRTVRFPLSEDRDEVTMRLDVTVPLTFAQQCNVLSLNPYPQGLVDITDIKYSTDTSDPSTTLPGFTAIQNAKATKFYFAPLQITKLRITFRQRHWTERDEQKVFVYGAQEIDLGLVEFDKTDEVSILSNNGIVVKVDSPDTFEFNKITNFFSDPDWATASNSSGIFFQIYTNAALTNKVWDSFTDPDPKSTQVDVSSYSVSRLYILIVLKYRQTAQVTPVLTSFGMAYTVQE